MIPHLHVAWLGDWDQNNGDQIIGYRITDKDVDVPSCEEDNSGSWKLYVRGGAQVWGSERGTDWRASGGVTSQF